MSNLTPGNLHLLKEEYMSEGCYALALALHESSGLPLGMLFDEGLQEKWNGKMQAIPIPVFCVLPGQPRRILDALGKRSIEEMRRYYHDVAESRLELNVSPAQVLVFCGDSDDKPFYGYNAQPRQDARQAVQDLKLHSFLSLELD